MPPAARHSPPPLAATVLAALAVAAAACFPGAARPPAAPVRGSLAPDLLAAPPLPPADGPLRVVFAGPRGETTQGTEVSFVFSKPMRPLGLGPHDPPPPVVMQPEVPGSWQWIGSSALRFNAARPLPLATPFRVEIPAGTKALDGAALAEPYVLDFSTPRPALQGSEPAEGAEDIPAGAALSLWFDQPIAADEIARAVSLRAGAGAPIPFTVALEDDRARLVPTTPLPLGAEVQVRVDPSLRGSAGPLPAGKEAVIKFRTVGPLAVESWTCAPHPTDAGACDPDSSQITLRLTNPAPAPDVLRGLSIEPRPEGLQISAIGPDEGTDEFVIDGSFAPATTYRVRLRARPGGRPLADVADVYGQRLPADATAALRFSDRPSDVTFGMTGVYWMMGRGPHVVPLRATNALDLGITAAPLAPADVLARLAGAGAGVRKKTAPVPPPDGAPRHAPPLGKRNEDRWSRFTLEDLLPPGGARGPVLLRASYRALGVAEASVESVEERELQLTDLGLLSRVARDGAAVWVTALGTGEPAPGTRVEVHHVFDGKSPAVTLLGAADVDAQGLARVALRGMPPPAASGDTGSVAVIARRGDDWAYQTISVPSPPEDIGVLFTERGIYRPGEEVHIKGAFRVPSTSGLATPRAREVDVRVEASDGREVASFRAPLSRFGTFARAVRIPDDAALGYFRVVAQLDRIRGLDARPGWGRGRHYPDAVTWRFAVDEYRPAESTTEATVDRSEYAPGDTLRCGARGKYLYGAPMAGSRASIVVSRSSGSPSLPGHQDFVFGDHDALTPSAPIAQGSGVLDARGAFALPVTLALPGQVGAETITCSVEIADQNRQVRSDQTYALLHQGDLYVGLERADNWRVLAGDTLRSRVIAVTPAGVRRAVPVRVEIVKRARPENAPPVDEPLGACDLTSGPEPVPCAIKLPAADPGEDDQVIVRASARDTAGRRVAASYAIALAPRPKPQPPPPPPPAPSPPTPRLTLLAPDTRYEVGQTAKISVLSPASRPARALVTLAREGFLLERVIDLPPRAQGPASLDIPITPAMVPNAYLSVIAVVGDDVHKESTELRIHPGSRRLQVAVVPARKQAAPGDALDVEVTVRDAAGKPARAEVTLWAADEGTLQLTHYSVPDLMPRMFAERYQLIETADARDQLLSTWMGGRHRTRAPQVRMGATTASPPRGDFRQTVFFAPDLVTDAAGRVRRRVKLPDGLTAYRFMAVAVAEDDRFGNAEAQVLTSKPLMARPTLPRVIRVGDRFEASVVLSTRDLPRTRVTVDARADGLVPLGPPQRAALLDPARPTELRFPFRADRPGRARFSIDATTTSAPGGSPPAPVNDRVVLTASAVLPLSLETAALHGDTASAVAEQLGDLQGIRPDIGGLSIALSPTPLAALAPAIEQLLEYPYGCTEQTVSRMIPLLALRDLARSLGVGLPGGAGTEVLADAVTRVLANQRADGGFGYWPASDTSDRWVTAYALWGLGEARRRGLPVRQDALDRAARYLEQHLAPAPSTATALESASDPELLATAAFVTDVLAAAGSPDRARMDALHAERDRLPLFAKALLLHAMATSRHTAEPIRELTRALETTVRIDGPLARVVTPSAAGHWPALLDSDARTTAMVLRALLAVDPRHPLASRLVLGLLDERRDGAWRTTQETAWSLLALDAWRRAQPPTTAPLTARVFLGDALLTESTFDPAAPVRRATATVPMTDLLAAAPRPLTFSASGGARLHYEATLRFARKTLPTTPIEAGFFLQKTMRPVSSLGAPGAPGAPRFNAGEVILCEIELVTPSPRRNVLLEDPLPGGLEPINHALRTGGPWLASLEKTPATRRELRDDRVVYLIDTLPAGIHHFSYLARATTPGTFIAPPTRVEEMYAPETFGRTPASTVEVVAP